MAKLSVAQKILKSTIIQMGLPFVIPVLMGFLEESIKNPNSDKAKKLLPILQDLKQGLDNILDKLNQ